VPPLTQIISMQMRIITIHNKNQSATFLCYGRPARALPIEA